MDGVNPNPLTIACPFCPAAIGQQCRTAAGTGSQRPHAMRRKLAVVLAGHADPALDEHFPHHGPCGICGTPGLGARHRVIDGIAGMLAAGEDPNVTAEEHGTSPEAVAMVTLWMVRWPGAWL